MIQINPSFNGDDRPKTMPRFALGQIVRHKRYGYRGVVVAFDSHCKAPPDWYMANNTQPARDQAWYHVLVDGSSGCTYPAEENLRPDNELSDVRHPLLAMFFSGFEDGRYVRNGREWPE